MSIGTQQIFQQYLKSNVQIGIADIFELQTLTAGKNVCTLTHSAQIGKKHGFNGSSLLEELKQAFPQYKFITHASVSKSSVDLYIYASTNAAKYGPDVIEDEMVFVSLINISNEKTNTTTVMLEDVFETTASVYRKVVFDDEHTVCVLIAGQNGVTESSKAIQKSNAPIPKDCFYPFLQDDITTYFQKFLESDASILLLVGPPGTGKSSFTRALILHTEESAALVYDENTICSIDTLDHFYNSPHRILALEDADAFIGKREEGNRHLSAYLNYTDGIAKNPYKKLVISTNLGSLAKVDPALLRKGRCYDVVQFRELTPAEANVARAEVGLPEKAFDKPIVLAEALDKGGDELYQKRNGGIGFTN